MNGKIQLFRLSVCPYVYLLVCHLPVVCLAVIKLLTLLNMFSPYLAHKTFRPIQMEVDNWSLSLCLLLTIKWTKAELGRHAYYDSIINQSFNSPCHVNQMVRNG